LTLRCPFNHDYASDVEENDHHCLHILPTFHEQFVPFKNSRTRPLTVWNILSEFFSISQEISDWLRCSIFILVTNPAEQHNMVTLKQSSEATNWHRETRDESSLVRFEKLQGGLPITRAPLQQVPTVDCA
jgi:hypothetical protein